MGSIVKYICKLDYASNRKVFNHTLKFCSKIISENALNRKKRDKEMKYNVYVSTILSNEQCVLSLSYDMFGFVIWAQSAKVSVWLGLFQ